VYFVPLWFIFFIKYFKYKLTTSFTKDDIEILIATMNQSSLDFLIPMFPDSALLEIPILIVNQTNETNLLVSDNPKIRVINSFEKGLSKSRNLALKNAKGKILLIADDDVVYHKNVISTILDAYNAHPKAASIVFCATNLEGKSFKKYPKQTKPNLNRLDIYNVMSIEMTLNKAIIAANSVIFDEDFGLGSPYIMGEEAVFLNDLKNKKQQIVFVPTSIVSHLEETTNHKISLEQKYHLIGALYSRNYKKACFLWIIIQLFFDLKQSKIRWKQVVSLYKIAHFGRLHYLKHNK
jgi:glycosyltransferase involved in cell wall biosynthesis